MHRQRHRSRFLLLCVVLGATAMGAMACSDETGGSTSSTPRPPVPPEPTNLGSGPSVPTEDDGPIGLVAIGIEEVEGIFVEGFEVALRLEIGEGEVIDAALWSDLVAAQELASPTSAYEMVWERPVPAGPIVVFAQVEVGTGPPPSRPDPNGELDCRLELDVAEAERVRVEVRFGAGDECLVPVER